MYGGLGDRHSFGLHETSHYLAPVIAWNLPSDWTLRLSPGFRPQRQQPPIPAALGRLPRIFRIRCEDQPPARRALMIARRLAGSRGKGIANRNTPSTRSNRMFRLRPVAVFALASVGSQRRPRPHPRTTPPSTRNWRKLPRKSGSPQSAGTRIPTLSLRAAKSSPSIAPSATGTRANGGKKGPSLRADEVQQATPGTLFWLLTNGVVRQRHAGVVQAPRTPALATG